MLFISRLSNGKKYIFVSNHHIYADGREKTLAYFRDYNGHVKIKFREIVGFTEGMAMSLVPGVDKIYNSHSFCSGDEQVFDPVTGDKKVLERLLVLMSLSRDDRKVVWEAYQKSVFERDNFDWSQISAGVFGDVL